MSASSAGAIRASPPRSTSPRPAPTWCSSRRIAWPTRASGRNGGQIHSGQRRDVLWLEERFGFEHARRLWDIAEEAKALVRALVVRFAIACDLRAGVIEALHKPALVRDWARLIEALNSRYGYDRASLLDRADTVAALGSERFYGAMLDRGGGHLDPYKFAVGLARAATGLGVRIHENTPATSLGRDGGPLVRTSHGEIRAEHVIIATDGRSGPLEQVTRRRMVGINSFVVATEPLGAAGESILPGGESAADSRFVVRYWRKTPDGRLVFGGGESNAGRFPDDVRAFVRPHLDEVYPQLSGVPVEPCLGRDCLGHHAPTAVRAAKSRRRSGRPEAIRARGSRWRPSWASFSRRQLAGARSRFRR